MVGQLQNQNTHVMKSDLWHYRMFLAIGLFMPNFYHFLVILALIIGENTSSSVVRLDENCSMVESKSDIQVSGLPKVSMKDAIAQMPRVDVANNEGVLGGTD